MSYATKEYTYYYTFFDVQGKRQHARIQAQSKKNAKINSSYERGCLLSVSKDQTYANLTSEKNDVGSELLIGFEPIR